MQSQNPIIADLVKLANSAAGTMAGMTREARESARERLREAMGGIDFVSREEFETVKAMAAKAREQADALEAEADALEGRCTEPAYMRSLTRRRQALVHRERAEGYAERARHAVAEIDALDAPPPTDAPAPASELERMGATKESVLEAASGIGYAATTEEVVRALGIEVPTSRLRATQMAIGAILRAAGWERRRLGRVWVYRQPMPEDQSGRALASREDDQ